MNGWKKLAIGFVAVVVVFTTIVAMRPGSFTVERSITIDRDARSVFARVVSFREWAAWSPWEKLDPNMKKTYSGPTAGMGATYSWSGNSEVGEGKQTMLEVDPFKSIRIRLDFEKPMKDTSYSQFTFTPEGNGTKVSWNMTGECNFMSKLFGLFMNFEKMIGTDFEKGLTSLKQVVESTPAVAPTPEKVASKTKIKAKAR